MDDSFHDRMRRHDHFARTADVRERRTPPVTFDKIVEYARICGLAGEVRFRPADGQPELCALLASDDGQPPLVLRIAAESTDTVLAVETSGLLEVPAGLPARRRAELYATALFLGSLGVAGRFVPAPGGGGLEYRIGLPLDDGLLTCAQLARVLDEVRVLARHAASELALVRDGEADLAEVVAVHTDRED